MVTKIFLVVIVPFIFVVLSFLNQKKQIINVIVEKQFYRTSFQIQITFKHIVLS